jgi:hypothetical protein
MSELTASNTAPYMSGFTINGSNPNQIDFVLQAGTNDAGNAINFGVSPWVADTQTFFTARVIVTFTDNTMGWSSVLSSLKPDTNPTDGVLYIKPIIYVWHCLAAGTQITMSDSTTQSVENMNVGMSVKTSGGGTYNVQATLAQPHWGTVFVILTQSGLSLTCSGTHPIMVPGGGSRPAGMLTTGSAVLTLNGTDTVMSVTTQQQAGEGLFNLWLDGPSGQSTFYANGFLVGDYQMQVALLPGNGNNMNLVREKLDPSLLTDFESYLADTADRRQREQSA